MKQILIYPVGSTDAIVFAARFLEHAGLSLTDHPCPEVTHLLLDVPSFASDGALQGGGSLSGVLERLPAQVTVIGGKLTHPALSGHPVIDLLLDPAYLAKNAAITAFCALRIAGSLLPVVPPDTPTLVIGWGRIGKCLTKYLSALGCPVAIAARNPVDRAMAEALGHRALDIPQIPAILSETRLVFNTAPTPILNAQTLDRYRQCVKIDLASSPGLQGSNVVFARGLPGQYAPESSGRLIAETVLRHFKEGTL